MRTLLMAFLLTLLCACFTGSGRLETKSFDVSDFDSIEIDMGVEVEVARDDRFTVSVTADDNLWDLLDVSRHDRTLHVELPSDRLYSNVTVHAIVSMPALASIDASGGSHAKFTGFDLANPSLNLHASGGSDIEGDANADALSIHASGGSRATLTGRVANATIEGSGGSHADLGALEADAADVSLSGGSTGAITVDHELGYHLSGGSHLVYSGDPHVGKSETSGGSSAEQK